MLTCSLQSGSNGNCIYVEADGIQLLFDAGISGRQADVRLASHGRDIRKVNALLLSHAHTDHTRGAPVFQSRYRLPIYTTAATAKTLQTWDGRRLQIRLFRPGDRLEFGSVRVLTLPTPHDATDSVAFIVEHAGRRLGVFTDLGHPFAELARALATLDAVYLESNYEPQMLAAGPYPPYLQARIRGDGGHLSNDEAAALLAGCDRGRLQWAALAHLSERNNDPDVALRTHRAFLGADFPLTVASRYEVSELRTV
jgi:phosphoribosyl 1,2-cyclic phosphodiesterase